ncbi:Uncharacterised protein [Vibrio cholerae]|nr:Uncharacterised protein [Vibrio cholerae]CSI23775.1 Uncharacterised protein [Vibrio cholerae]CSI45622.1 Uncharacterised protein [Vibrio cholerae]
MTCGNQFISKTAFFCQLSVRLSDNELTFFNRREVIHFVSHNTVDYATVRGF